MKLTMRSLYTCIQHNETYESKILHLNLNVVTNLNQYQFSRWLIASRQKNLLPLSRRVCSFDVMPIENTFFRQWNCSIKQRYCWKTNLYELISFCRSLTSIVTFAKNSVRQAIKGALRMYVGQQDTYDCKVERFNIRASYAKR